MGAQSYVNIEKRGIKKYVIFPGATECETLSFLVYDLKSLARMFNILVMDINCEHTKYI